MVGALREFVAAHPDGWGHGEWEALLAELKSRKLDARDEVAIGAALERERLLATLERAGVKGVGPKRRNALADRFGRLWELQHASASEVAEGAGLTAEQAEAVLRSVRR
jgi:excinuclease UvrABC nuclease subunit